MLQLCNDEFTSFSFQITDSLLSCMKVNADIYFHSASFQSPVTEHCRESSTHGGGACFITSVPSAVADGCAAGWRRGLPGRAEMLRTHLLPQVVLTLSMSVLTHMQAPEGITQLLIDWENGDQNALEK